LTSPDASCATAAIASRKRERASASVSPTRAAGGEVRMTTGGSAGSAFRLSRKPARALCAASSASWECSASDAPGDTAFVHRKSLWLSSIELYWSKTTSDAVLRQNLAWLDAYYEAIVPHAKGGAYQNFIDPSLVDWKSAYYGSNLERLETIKRRVDPAGVFAFAEAIPG